METITTKKRAKTQNRNVWDVNSMIRICTVHKKIHTSWLTRFTTSKDSYFKQVHVFNDSAILMLMSTSIEKEGMHITGSLSYKLDNLPNFIKRHIDFDVLKKAKKENSLEFRAFGLIFRDGILIKRNKSWEKHKNNYGYDRY